MQQGCARQQVQRSHSHISGIHLLVCNNTFKHAQGNLWCFPPEMLLQNDSSCTQGCMRYGPRSFPTSALQIEAQNHACEKSQVWAVSSSLAAMFNAPRQVAQQARAPKHHNKHTHQIVHTGSTGVLHLMLLTQGTGLWRHAASACISIHAWVGFNKGCQRDSCGGSSLAVGAPGPEIGQAPTADQLMNCIHQSQVYF